MRKLWNLFWVMVNKVINFTDEKLYSLDMEYNTFEENLFKDHFSTLPKCKFEFEYPTEVGGVSDLIEGLSPYELHSNWNYDEHGFFTVEKYYRVDNIECLCILKTVMKQSLPYEFVGDRYPGEGEFKMWEMSTSSLSEAFKVSEKLNLAHFESLTFVTDVRNKTLIEETRSELKHLHLQRSDMKYVNSVGEELKKSLLVET